MKLSKLEDTLRDLLEKGYGRKRIAEELGLTEWQARHLLDEHKKRHPLPITKEMYVVACGDFHVPFHDRMALDILLNYLRHSPPDKVILLGDIVDFYQISRFLKDPGRQAELQNDLDTTVSVLREIREAVPDSEIIFIEGNHSYRLTKYLWRSAPELYSLKILSLPYVLQLPELGIALVPYGNEYKIGNVSFLHGNLARKRAGYTAHAVMEALGTNVVIGHMHRLAVVHRTAGDDVFTGIEAGCLCNLDQPYTYTRPDWQHGFVTLHFVDGGDWSYQIHRIQNRRLVTDYGIFSA